MMIAAAANENDMTALIPDTMENARGVMLFDLETDDPPECTITPKGPPASYAAFPHTVQTRSVHAAFCCVHSLTWEYQGRMVPFTGSGYVLLPPPQQTA